jgi:hypothetical protein
LMLCSVEEQIKSLFTVWAVFWLGVPHRGKASQSFQRAPETPRELQRAPREAPRAPESPREPQRAPDSPQTTPESPQKVPRAAESPRELPELQRVPELGDTSYILLFFTGAAEFKQATGQCGRFSWLVAQRRRAHLIAICSVGGLLA